MARGVAKDTNAGRRTQQAARVFVVRRVAQMDAIGAQIPDQVGTAVQHDGASMRLRQVDKRPDVGSRAQT